LGGNRPGKYGHPNHMPRRRGTEEPSFAAPKPTMDQFLGMRLELNRTRTQFLKTDVQTALTFSSIALNTGRSPETRRRNLTNARKGYDTITAFLPKVTLSPEDREFLRVRLVRLKSELEELGESF
jgi:hypothetical protein